MMWIIIFSYLLIIYEATVLCMKSVPIESFCSLISGFSRINTGSNYISATECVDELYNALNNGSKIENQFCNSSGICNTKYYDVINKYLTEENSFFENFIAINNEEDSITTARQKSVIDLVTEIITNKYGVDEMGLYFGVKVTEQMDVTDLHGLIALRISSIINQLYYNYKMFLSAIPGFTCEVCSNPESLKTNMSYLIVPKKNEDYFVEICITKSLNLSKFYCSLIKSLYGSKLGENSPCTDENFDKYFVRNAYDWCDPVVWKVLFSSEVNYGTRSHSQIIYLINKIIQHIGLLVAADTSNDTSQKNAIKKIASLTNEQIIAEIESQDFLRDISLSELIGMNIYGEFNKDIYNSINTGTLTELVDIDTGLPVVGDNSSLDIIQLSDSTKGVSESITLLSKFEANQELSSFVEKVLISSKFIDSTTGKYGKILSYFDTLFVSKTAPDGEEQDDVHFSDTTLGGDEDPNYPYEQPDVLPQVDEKPEIWELDPTNPPKKSSNKKLIIGLSCGLGIPFLIGIIVALVFIIKKCTANHSSRIRRMMQAEGAESESVESEKYIHKSLPTSAMPQSNTESTQIEIHEVVQKSKRYCSSSDPLTGVTNDNGEPNNFAATEGISVPSSENFCVVQNNENSVQTNTNDVITSQQSLVEQVSKNLTDYCDMTVPIPEEGKQKSSFDSDDYISFAEESQSGIDIKQRMNF